MQRAGARRKLVVLGTGWGGFRLIRDIDITRYSVNVISPRNHFLFTPLLTSTTVGTLEFRGVSEPIHNARPGLNYVQASCTDIDTVNKVVTFESVYDQRDSEDALPFKPKSTMRYDDLVIAVGAVPNTFGIPGVEKYCFFLKQLADARAIRQRILECFERAYNPATSEAERKRLLHFVIIGGGPTSVEFAAELHDFLKQDVHKVFPGMEKLVQISLIEAGKTLLSTFDARLSEYTMRTFKKRNIDVRTGVAVKEVHRHHIILSDGSIIPFGLGVWSTGVAPTPLVKSLNLPKDKTGRLIVNDYLQVDDSQVKDVYAIGDCAIYPKNPLPATAQAAEQEGKYVANLLNRKAAKPDLPLKPFHYNYQGMLAYIGGHRALVDTPVLKNSGFFSWLLWNAAYITKLVSVKNKIMIPMYWFKSWVFGRDVTRF